MCSFNSTKATRFIGVFGVIISLLIINLLAKTDLSLQDNIPQTTEILLGLEWRDFVPFEDRTLPKELHLIFFQKQFPVSYASALGYSLSTNRTLNGIFNCKRQLVVSKYVWDGEILKAKDRKGLPFAVFMYAVIHVCANLFLILATITENYWFTVPWIFSQSTGIVCQCLCLYIHLTEEHDYQPQLICLASSCIVIMTSLWIIVFYTQNRWRTCKEYSLDEEEADCAENSKVKQDQDLGWDSIDISMYKFETYKEI